MPFYLRRKAVIGHVSVQPFPCDGADVKGNPRDAVTRSPHKRPSVRSKTSPVPDGVTLFSVLSGNGVSKSCRRKFVQVAAVSAVIPSPKARDANAVRVTRGKAIAIRPNGVVKAVLRLAMAAAAAGRSPNA